MKLDQFLKARLKITFFITIISSIIISIFSATIYYFYKEQIIYDLNDELKSTAFAGLKLIEKSNSGFEVLERLKIPYRGFVCIYDYRNSVLFFKGRQCDIHSHFTGFQRIEDNVVYGITFEKDLYPYHIYVGKSLLGIIAYLEKLKITLLYSAFVVSILIMFSAFFVSKQILSPIQETLERQERFTENVSHDLRTPLAVISTHLYAIKQKNFQNVEKNIQSIENTVEYMKKLISNILFMAQVKNQKINSKININSIIKRQLSIYETEINKKNLKVNFIENSQIFIEADEKDIEMMISNLIENAIKYNKENGEIIIETKNKTLTIKNTGNLIKEEDIDKIFDRFYRGEKSRTTEGTGLGLSIVKEIADHYKIKIKVKVDEKYNEFILKF